MKIKNDCLSLEVYGFVKVDDENSDFDCDLSFLDSDSYKWSLDIGSSRRGQSYYLLVSNDYDLLVVASKPDGDGGAVGMPDVILQMISDGIVLL